MVRTQIQLTDQQAKNLKKMATRNNTSVAALIRQGVDCVLKSAGEPSEEERIQRAIAVAGRFRSGKTDVSRRHDEYLGEAYRS